MKTRPALGALVLALAAGCGGPEDGALAVAADGVETFPPVGDMMVSRCGSLDCHGSLSRNMIVWGRDGLRLDLEDVPGGDPTTGAEYVASFRSVVGLEPEVFARVRRDGGRGPERLTVVRKYRGAEKHKGKRIGGAGGDVDVCVTSWLSGSADEQACHRASLGGP